MNPNQVPPGPVVVDTDVFSWTLWRRQRYAEYDALLAGHLRTVSFATVGELWSGAENAGWGAPRRAQLDATIRQYYVPLGATDAVVRKWGQLDARLRDQVGDNDLWIAATALAQPGGPLPVVTGNRAHFEMIAREDPALFIVHPDI